MYLIFQRYKLKANHNCNCIAIRSSLGVFDISKMFISEWNTKLALVLQRAKNIFAIGKDTNLKANHNSYEDYRNAKEVYLIFQRYKFKSKSQHILQCLLWGGGVFNISKIQIQKQITTFMSLVPCTVLVYWYFKDVHKRVKHKACIDFTTSKEHLRHRQRYRSISLNLVFFL